jgi:hypothetical protein
VQTFRAYLVESDILFRPNLTHLQVDQEYGLRLQVDQEYGLRYLESTVRLKYLTKHKTPVANLFG